MPNPYESPKESNFFAGEIPTVSKKKFYLGWILNLAVPGTLAMTMCRDSGPSTLGLFCGILTLFGILVALSKSNAAVKLQYGGVFLAISQLIPIIHIFCGGLAFYILGGLNNGIGERGFSLIYFLTLAVGFELLLVGLAIGSLKYRKMTTHVDGW